MPDTPMPLRHPETQPAEDSVLAQQSRSHVAGNGPLQLTAELVSKLRGSRFPWWTPELLRGAWDATERMGWFRQRPDVRQRITSGLTGLRPKAARNKEPDFQAALIDTVIDDGDVTVDEFENAFDAIELAAYAPPGEIWQRFRERMPWDQDLPQHQEVVAWLIDRLLSGASTIEGMTRQPILTAHAIRTTIPGSIWHSRIPLEIRVAIDESRFEQERARPGEPFRAIHDLKLATPMVIATSIPLRELLCVLDIAEQAMGLPDSRGAVEPRQRAAQTARAEPPKADVQAPPAAPTPEKVPEQVAEKPIPKPVDKAPERPAEKPVETPLDRAPEKPTEKPAERTMDRWERMASKVLETVGKESSNPEEPRGKDR